MFRSAVRNELTFVSDVKYGSKFNFLQVYVRLFQHNFLKRLSLPCRCAFVKNQFSISVWVYVWTLFCSIGPLSVFNSTLFSLLRLY